VVDVVLAQPHENGLVSLLAGRTGLPSPKFPQLLDVEIPINRLPHFRCVLVVAVEFLSRKPRYQALKCPHAFLSLAGKVHDLVG